MRYRFKPVADGYLVQWRFLFVIWITSAWGWVEAGRAAEVAKVLRRFGNSAPFANPSHEEPSV